MSTLKPEVNSTDHKQGNENAEIELVEYGDYECSYCGKAYPVIKKLQQEMGDRLLFVFRNFPLSESHPHAANAAAAAEAAAAQDKFWQMHDALYEHQQQLDDRSLVDYAKEIGVDVEKFTNDFESDATQKKIDDDFESGVRSGVNGTPSFYINGKKYEGGYSQHEMLAYLNSL